MTKFKAGDMLKCKPGFKTYGGDVDDGGAGWKDGMTFKVDHISLGDHGGKGPIYWPKSGCGIYEHAVELTEMVINEYQIY